MSFIVLILLCFTVDLQGFLLTRPLKFLKSIIYVKQPHKNDHIELNPSSSYDHYGEHLNSDNTLPIQSNLESNLSILYNQSLETRKSRANSALERYIEEFMGNLDSEPGSDGQWINEARDIVEKERGYAIWSSRSEDDIKKDTNKKLNNNKIANIPSEVLIVINAVFIEKICTLAELKLSEELLYNEYKKWLRHEKLKMKKDPMSNIRLSLVQKWLEQDPSDRLGFIRHYYCRRAHTRSSGILTRQSRSVVYDEYSTFLDMPPVVDIVPNGDNNRSLQREVKDPINSAKGLKGSIKASLLSSEYTDTTTGSSTAIATASSTSTGSMQQHKGETVYPFHTAAAERVLGAVPSIKTWHRRPQQMDSSQLTRGSDGEIVEMKGKQNSSSDKQSIYSSNTGSTVSEVITDIFTEDQMKWWLGITHDYFIVL